MFDNTDIHNLALVAWREDRGGGSRGCEAVMNVVCNRIGYPGFAKTLHEVIYGKNQFTSMSDPLNPEYRLFPQATDQLWLECLATAQEILSGKAKDITSRAHYYANLKYITKDGWFQKMILDDPKNHPQTVVIGGQTYFL